MSTKRRGLLQKVLMLIMVICLVCGNGLMALADEAVASTMRLTKTEGTVSVTNKNGRDMGSMADMKLFHGYRLATAQKSYAWMNLDDHKMVKLDAVSEAEIQKKGKDLEILLDSGNLLFNITESLKSDETLNVRTSTMVTGIRGTSGWVKVVDSRRTQVYILEGRVECYVMDPVTGENKSEILRSGEVAEFVVHDQNHVGDKCEIIINDFNEKNVDGFVAVELVDNPDLRDRVTNQMNIDMNWINSQATTILAQEQQEVEQKYVVINESVVQQENTVVKDPVFTPLPSSDKDDDNDGGSSSAPTLPPEDALPEEVPEENVTDTVDLYLLTNEAEFLATAENLETYLAMENILNVNIYIGESKSNRFMFDRPIVIDSGKTVTFAEGMDVYANEGQTLTINGTMNVSDGNLYNNGTINNNSNNTLNVTGTIQNNATGFINNVGRIIAADEIKNNGSVSNSGTISGVLTVGAGGEVTVSGGTVGSVTFVNGTLNMTGGTISEAELTDTMVIVEGGVIGNMNAVYMSEPPSFTMSGGVAENISVMNSEDNFGVDTIRIEGTSEIQSLTLSGRATCNIEGGYIGELFSDSTSQVNVDVPDQADVIGTVQATAGELTLKSGTVSRIRLLEDAFCTIDGCEVTDGIIMDSENSGLDIRKGTVRSGTLSAAIMFNAGALDVCEDAALIVDNEGDFIVFGPSALAANYVDTNGMLICVIDAVSMPLVEVTDGVVVLKQYVEDLAAALQNPQDGTHIMLSNDLELVAGNVREMNIFSGVSQDSQVHATLDLNGHYFTVASDYSLNISGSNGSKSFLTICDTAKEKGALKLDGTLNNYATLVFDDIELETSATLYNYENSHMEFNGGTCSFAGWYFLENIQGTVKICNAADMDIAIVDYDGWGGICNMGGNVYIGEEDSTDPVRINMTMATPIQDALAFIEGSIMGVDSTGNDYIGKIELYNADLNVTNGYAVRYDGGSYQLIIGEGAKIQADASMGTIWCEGSPYDDCIVFDGGEIINTCNGGGLGAIVVEYFSTDGLPPAIIPDAGELKTILKAKDSSIVTFCFTDMTGSDGGFQEIFNPYNWEGNGYVIGEEDEFYYVPGTASQVFTMRRPASADPTPSDPISPESTPAPDNTVIATSSDALPSDATPSNASGTPTASESAIPLVVAMLAGLMGIAPKHRERRRKMKE